MNRRLLIIVLIYIIIVGCRENPPVEYDGSSSINLVAVWDTSSVPGVVKNAPLSGAKVILNSEYGTFVRYLDENGKLTVNNIPAATYDIAVRKPHPLDNNIIIVGNIKGIKISQNTTVTDTLFGTPVSNSGIAINEIYSCGPVNNVYFFYDQYIELYNSSDSIKYMDGMIIMRVSGNGGDGQLGPGADEGDDGDIDGVTYIFKFPGNPGEKTIPFYPKTFMLLASDAVNHKNSMPNAVDLSNAEWEFFNQYSANDIDNPNVPNLINLRSDRTTDFLISLTNDVIVLADGRDIVWEDGIDISTIIDGVEYQTSATSRKTLDPRVDRSWVKSPPTYSGKSIQRREPGVDTNDGQLDWEILPSPTPGYQK